VYWGLGDKSKALEWLERAYEERSATLAGIGVDPGWDGFALIRGSSLS